MFRSLLVPLFVLLVLCLPSTVPAQEWVRKMDDPQANFYEIRDAFEAHWQDRDHTVRGSGWKPFQRWAYFWEPRVYPSGEFPRPDVTARALSAYRRVVSPFVTRANASDWTSLGPDSWITVSYNPGIGRINCVERDPVDPNVVYAGAPSGGFWKSTDAGATWMTTTDHLPVLGVSDIAINPADRNEIYIATGDGDAGDTYSIGILKSSDAGMTWQPTGFSWDVIQGRRITRLLIHPTQPQVLLAGTNVGIYKSTDGGDTWSLTRSGSIRDMHFKSGDPSVVFAAGTAFYRSDNGGDSWSTVSVPAGGQVGRYELAVTPADPEYVYLLAGDNATNGFLGLYRSTDGGQSFSERSTSPNILGYAFDGSSGGGQAWYDLALAVSPTDRDEVHAGGINIWKSVDGGLSWGINTYWVFTDSRRPYVHADIHTLEYAGDDLYAGSDGGLFVTGDGGASWLDISAGMATSQFYRIGGYPGDPALVIGGTQDNGTNRFDNGQWTHVLGADGMEASIDWSNPNIMYACIQNGGLRRSINGGETFFDITGGINEGGYWVTPHQIDPVDPAVIYAGFVNVWKSTTRGNTWTRISTFSGNTLRSLAVAPSDPNTIYAGTASSLRRTRDGGATWTDVFSGLPTTASMTYVAVNPVDPLRIYATFSGYRDGDKVFRSADGGDTWENISGTLPNLPVNCVVSQPGGGDPLYVGTDVGVFYRNERIGDWEPFSTGLPNVIVRELEIHEASGTLKAATYGRGLWASPLEPAGPVISHLPLGEREDEVGPYRVVATVDTISGALVTDSLRIVFGTDGVFANSVEMTPTGNADEYEGWIPGPGGPAQMAYYLTAVSVSGGYSADPVDAPARAHSFYVGPDTVPPVLAHAPITRGNIEALPLMVHAEASDNIALAEVRVDYHLNGVAATGFRLHPSGDGFSGEFPLGADDLSVGDVVSYSVTARDSTSRNNTTVSGPHEFIIERVLNYLSAPDVDIPPSASQSVSDTLTIAGTAGLSLMDADLLFRAAHANFGDLQVTLTTPGGAVLLLIDRAGHPADPFGIRGEDPDIVLDDEAALSIEDADFGEGETVTGRFRPDPDALSVLDGLPLDGDWILTVTDAKPAHVGRFLEWGLLFSVDGATGIAGAGDAALAGEFALYPNYPNPFNPTTTIAYRVGRSGQVALRIFNALGQEVRTLVDARQPAGRYEVVWDGRDGAGRGAASGLYFYRLESEGVRMSGKMLLMK